MAQKLRMKMTQKINTPFVLTRMCGNFNWVKACMSLLLPVVAVNVLAQEITEFPVYSNDFKSPHQAEFDSKSKTLKWFDQPVGIAVSEDGSVWYTENNAGRIGRRMPDSTIKEYQIGGPHGTRGFQNRPNITIGADGNIWFTTGRQIDSIAPSGKVTMHPKSYSPDFEIGSVVLGADGNIWYTKRQYKKGLNLIGKITPSDEVKEFPLAAPLVPMNLAVGPDGNIWFTEYAEAAPGNPGGLPIKIPVLRIAKISSNGKVTEYNDGITIPTSRNDHVVADSDGKLWIIPDSGGRIASITIDGHVTEYSVNSDILGGAVSVVKGPDGNLWVANGTDEIVGRITLPNKIDIYHFPQSKIAASFADGDTTIGAGRNNDLWITYGDHGLLEHITFGKQAFLSGFNSTLSTNEIIAKISPPTNSTELLQNIKIAVDVDLPSRDDFYISENLEKIFGVANIKVEESSYKNTESENEIVRKAEFKNREGIEVIVLKRRSSLNNAQFTAQIGLRSQKNIESIALNTIQEIFGANWKFMQPEINSEMLGDKVIESDHDGTHRVIAIRTSATDRVHPTEILYTETTEKKEYGN